MRGGKKLEDRVIAVPDVIERLALGIVANRQLHADLQSQISSVGMTRPPSMQQRVTCATCDGYLRTIQTLLDLAEAFGVRAAVEAAVERKYGLIQAELALARQREGRDATLPVLHEES